MPNEPERDIEKRLKAYAEKRRHNAGEPLELHPATRRLLQGEVSRRRAKRAGGANWLARFLATHGPRLAYATGVAAVLVVIGVLFFPALLRSKKETQLTFERDRALAETSPAEATKIQPAEPPPQSARPGMTAKDENRPQPAAEAARSDKGLFTANGAAPLPEGSAKVVPPPVAAPESNRAKADQTLVAGAPVLAPATRFESIEAPELRRQEVAATREAEPEKPKASLGLSGLAEAKRPAAVAPQPALETGKLAGSVATLTPPASSTVVFNQNFAQVASQTAVRVAARKVTAQPRLPNVLNNFRVEQSGESIRIVDEDGSTYAGYAQVAGPSQLLQWKTPADTLAPQVASERKPAVGVASGRGGALEAARQLADKAAEPQQLQAGNYFFRVTGTNRALNEPVVFTGNLFVPTNVVSAAAQFMDNKGAQLLNAPGKTGQDRLQTMQSQLQNSRITGTAVVGEKQTVNIDAVSVPTQ